MKTLFFYVFMCVSIFIATFFFIPLMLNEADTIVNILGYVGIFVAIYGEVFFAKKIISYKGKVNEKG